MAAADSGEFPRVPSYAILCFRKHAAQDAGVANFAKRSCCTTTMRTMQDRGGITKRCYNTVLSGSMQPQMTDFLPLLSRKPFSESLPRCPHCEAADDSMTFLERLSLDP